jgi:hypothetical protein
MKGWEFIWVTLGLPEQEQMKDVNRLGAQGWEPFAAPFNPKSGHTVFLRRPFAWNAVADANEIYQHAPPRHGEDRPSTATGMVPTP